MILMHALNRRRAISIGLVMKLKDVANSRLKFSVAISMMATLKEFYLLLTR